MASLRLCAFASKSSDFGFRISDFLRRRNFFARLPFWLSGYWFWRAHVGRRNGPTARGQAVAAGAGPGAEVGKIPVRWSRQKAAIW